MGPWALINAGGYLPLWGPSRRHTDTGTSAASLIRGHIELPARNTYWSRSSATSRPADPEAQYPPPRGFRSPRRPRSHRHLYYVYYSSSRPRPVRIGSLAPLLLGLESGHCQLGRGGLHAGDLVRVIFFAGFTTADPAIEHGTRTVAFFSFCRQVNPPRRPGSAPRSGCPSGTT